MVVQTAQFWTPFFFLKCKAQGIGESSSFLIHLKHVLITIFYQRVFFFFPGWLIWLLGWSLFVSLSDFFFLIGLFALALQSSLLNQNG